MRAILLGILLFACDPAPADQLVVEVVDGSGGRLQFPDDLDAFELRVATQFGNLEDGRQVTRYRRTFRLGADRGGIDLPQSLAVVPAQDGSSGTVTVEVLGLRDGRPRQRILRTTTFGSGLVRMKAFELTPACFGVLCPPGQTCEGNGECGDALLECPGPGCPVDAGTGPCGADQIECAGACIPQDDTNCGGCGVTCAPQERCVGGACLCEAGLTSCGGTCVDTRADETHCGDCGVTCTAPRANVECVSSSCVVGGCSVPGFGDCNGRFDDGCETRTTADRNHCGVCGNRCRFANGTPGCASGICRLFGCNSGWADCDDVEANGCETMSTCVAGSPCTTSCGTAGTTDCGGGCLESCTAPAETCNGEDDDCDGTCDEGGCRQGVNRGRDPMGGHMGVGGAHLYSLGTTTIGDPRFVPYFYTYVAQPSGGYQALYRCSHDNGPDFVTRSAACEGTINGTVVETLGFVSPSAQCGATPLYRLYNAASRGHFYTISATERDTAVNNLNFQDEGIEGYVWAVP